MRRTKVTLIGNIMFEGNDLDAIYLKPNGIAVIEMKGHGGKVTFHESTAWKVGASDVIGGTRQNAEVMPNVSPLTNYWPRKLSPVN